MGKKIIVYDTTLRDGMQGTGSHFTIEDKIRIAKLLDNIGVDFIEGGAPGFNPKDSLFFEVMKKTPLKSSKLVAFGSTVRSGISCEEDEALTALVKCPAEYVCVFGKAALKQVKTVLGITPEENLELIRSTIEYLKSNGKHVFFDAEHFFGADDEYRNTVLDVAEKAGAELLFLCDTNGCALPGDVSGFFEKDKSGIIGIHAHNDAGMAVANSVVAVLSGATCIQSTLLGIGERCGNADMFSVLPTLQVTHDYECIPKESMTKLSEFYYNASELLNVKAFARSPFVGRDAFSHKGGMHIDAVLKDSTTYEVTDPSNVGNKRRLVVSEMSGKAAVTDKINKLMPEISIDAEGAGKVLGAMKNNELEGFQYEGADASFEMLVRKTLGMTKSYFELKSYRVVSVDGESSAMVDVFVGDEEEVTASNGKGPVDALDGAFRKALARFYPELTGMKLVDYKVRVLDTGRATASKVRVLIESTDGNRNWVTVGVSEDIIEASKIALMDSHEYMLYSSTTPKN